MENSYTAIDVLQVTNVWPVSQQYDPYSYSNDYDLHTGLYTDICSPSMYKMLKFKMKPLITHWRCSFSHPLAGDPKADLAYERQYEQQTYHVIPEVIKNFLQYFHKTISDLIDQKVYELQSNRVSSESIEQKIYEIQDVYENR